MQFEMVHQKIWNVLKISKLTSNIDSSYANKFHLLLFTTSINIAKIAAIIFDAGLFYSVLDGTIVDLLRIVLRNSNIAKLEKQIVRGDWHLFISNHQTVNRNGAFNGHRISQADQHIRGSRADVLLEQITAALHIADS